MEKTAPKYFQPVELFCETFFLSVFQRDQNIVFVLYLHAMIINKQKNICETYKKSGQGRC
jgi:hypothetical protein